MFDIGWSELLILAVVTLLFVGPKDLPVFLRTIGRFMSVIRKQAGEFRAQFDEAMRETELDQIRKDMAGLRDEVSGTVRQAQRSVESELNATGRELDQAAKGTNAKGTDTTAPSQVQPSSEAQSPAQTQSPSLSQPSPQAPSPSEVPSSEAKPLASAGNGSGPPEPSGERPEKQAPAYAPADKSSPALSPQTNNTEEKSRV